jgi:hypothetical protein
LRYIQYLNSPFLIMASTTEKQLQQMLNIQSRIEKMLEGFVDKKKDKGAEPATTEISTEFANIAKSLESIDKESKQTNVLLKELIAAQTHTSKETSKDISAAAKAMESLGGGVEKIVQVAKEAGSVTDGQIDSFRKIILVSAFINPDDGKPLVDEKHLDAAARATQGIMSIAKGVLLMGLTMVLFSFVLPQIMEGFIGFTVVVAGMALAVFLLSRVMKVKDGEPAKDSPLQALTALSISIATFGLTFVLMSFVLPQIFKGSIGFLTVMATVALGIWMLSKVLTINDGADKGKFKDTGPLSTLWKLAASVAMFALTFVLISFVLPQIGMGALGFLGIMASVALGIWMLNKVLSDKDGKFKDTGPLSSLWKLSLSIAIFSLTFIVINLAWSYIWPGAIGFIALLASLGVALFIFDKIVNFGKKPIKPGKGNTVAPEGEGPLAALTKAAWGIAILSGVMILISFFAKEFAIGMGLLSVSLALIAGGMALLGLETTQKGVATLRKLAIDLAIFTGVMLVWGTVVDPNLSWEAIGKLGAVIAGVSLIATILGIPPIAGFAIAGAKALQSIGISLVIFSAGLAVYAQMAAPNLNWEKIAILGAVIGIMSLVGTILGIPVIFPFVMLGAVALTALGIALIPFTIGLSIFAKSGFNKEHSDNLNSALRATMAGFLGYKSLDEMGMAALIKVPLMIAGVLGAGMAMIPVSISLMVLTGALATFKKIQWTEKDSESLNAAITGVTKGFTEAMDDVNWVSLWYGVESLKNVGRSLTGLAEGVQAFANLTFNEYEFDKASGEMKLVNKVKLTPADIAATGVSIGMVISAVTKPLAEFGEQMTGGSGSGFLGVDWGKMISINFGINSLASIGTGLVNMAQGVQDWANMTVTEYGIQKNKETGLNELVPISRRKITSSDIQNATYNIGYVLSGLSRPLSEFGKIFTSEEKGWFGSTYQVENKGLKLGIEGLANIGTGLVNMADGVVKWANMEYTEFGIGKDKNTGLNVLMPIGTRKISKNDVSKATYNIGYTLSALAYPLSEFGKIFTTTEKGWFGSTYDVTNEGLLTGIEQMANIGNNLGMLADAMAKWANLEYTEMEVHKKKDGSTTLQPKSVKKIGIGGLLTAQFNIGLVLSTMAKAFVNYYQELQKGGWAGIITEQIKELGNTQKVLGGLADFLHSKWGDDKMTKSSENYKLWLYNTADPIIGKMLTRYKGLGDNIGYFDKRFQAFSTPVKSMAFSTFTNNIVKLAKYASPFERFTAAFNKMAVSMGLFANNFNIMSPEGVQAFTVWTNTLVKAIEVGKDAEKGMYDKFLKTSEGALESAFQFGKNMLGTGQEATSDSEKKSIIDETIKGKEKGADPQMGALLAAIKSLQGEVSGLKSAISSTLNVNVKSVSNTAVMKVTG